MKSPNRYLFTVLAICMFQQTLFAQFPRKILFELFTNRGCVPCTTANILTDAFTAQHASELVCIKYHVGFPDPNDPFYQYNPLEATNRFSYYGNGGVPKLQMDGTSAGTPFPYGPVFVARQQIPSPFELKTTFTIKDKPGSIPDSIYLTTVVKAGSFVFNNNLKLRVAAIEKYSTFGVNYLFSYFKDVMRKMIPDSEGIVLPSYFGIGDSVIITTGAELPFYYDLHQLAIASFVQDDSTKEVLQAADGVDDPIYSINITDMPKSVKMVNDNGIAQFNIPFRITTKLPRNFSIVARAGNPPPGWSQNISLNGQSNIDSLHIYMPANADSVIELQINANSGSLLNSHYDMDIRITCDGSPDNYLNFNGMHPNLFYPSAYSKCINMVFNLNWHSQVIETALTQTGNSYICPMQFVSRFDTVNFNKASIQNLFVTYNYDTIKTEFPLMLNLLKSGGNVYLEGEELGQHVFGSASMIDAQNFYHDYLGADYLYTNNTPQVTIDANPGDYFYGNTLSSGPFGIIYSVMAPYVSSPYSSPIFYFNNNSSMVAGLRNTDGNFKTAFFGFFPSGLPDMGITNQIIQSTINWFNANTTGIENNETGLPQYDYQNAPNPASDKTYIKLPASLSERSICVSDIQGNEMMRNTIPSHSDIFELNVSQLPAGIYFYRILENQGIVAVHKLIVSR